MIVDNQKNLKVHFAGCEVQNQFAAVKAMDIKYCLYTAFPFLERLVLGTKKSPLMIKPLAKAEDIPQYIVRNARHCIQDSGLFTLMFGSHKGNKNAYLMDKWYNGLIEFSLNYSNGATIVEVDCQKVLGVEKAWEYRQRLKHDLKDYRQINVFHKEDGQAGLDRLIEFSDYIAISVPELRFLGQKEHCYKIASYIKNKKPDIDIHLLGCTELKMLKQMNFCSSSDSTTYIAGKRYGFIMGKHINQINQSSIIDLVGQEIYNEVNLYNNTMNTNFLLLSIWHRKNMYSQYAGNQD